MKGPIAGELHCRMSLKFRWRFILGWGNVAALENKDNVSVRKLENLQKVNWEVTMTSTTLADRTIKSWMTGVR